MPGTNSAIAGGGFHHVAIRSADFDRSVRFYTEGLGFRRKIAWGEGTGRAVMLDTGDGNYLEIFANGTPGEKPEGCIVHFALRTGDCDRAVARARAAGARITVEPRDVLIPSDPPTAVRLAFCTGPDGEVIEFFQNTAT
jgi:glyoxylase I family protein